MRKKIVILFFIFLLIGVNRVHAEKMKIADILKKIEETMEITNDVTAKVMLTQQKVEQGIKIITDPYEPGYAGLSYGPIPDEADIVTVSHDHGDHNYVAGVPGTPQVVKGAGRQEAKGIVFEGIAAYHDESRGSQRGDNTIFTFVTDGIRMCHAGDLGISLRLRTWRK